MIGLVSCICPGRLFFFLTARALVVVVSVSSFVSFCIYTHQSQYPLHSSNRVSLHGVSIVAPQLATQKLLKPIQMSQ